MHTSARISTRLGDELDRNVLDVRLEFPKTVLFVAIANNRQREHTSFQFDSSFLYFVGRVEYSHIEEYALNIIEWPRFHPQIAIFPYNSLNSLISNILKVIKTRVVIRNGQNRRKSEMKNKKGEIRRINSLIINSLNEAIFIQVFQITRSSILL